jgi:cell division protein FtsQ
MTAASPRTAHRARKSQQAARPARGRRGRLQRFAVDLVRTGRLPAFLLSVGLAVVLAAFALSDDFLVDTVIIRGNSIAYADSVVETSGAMGEAIFRVDTGEIAVRVADHPAIASAEVRAELPDRIVVTVVEREPEIVWQTGERAVLVDPHGWVIAEGTREGLPRVIELTGSVPRPGEQMAPETVATVLHLWETFGDEILLEHDAEHGFLVHLQGNRTIAFGQPELIPMKLQVVERVASSDVSWSRLDVRDPERPVYQ